MKQQKATSENQCLYFSDRNIIVIDKIQDLPRNGVYCSEYVIIMACIKGRIQMNYDNKSITVQKGQLFYAAPGSILSDFLISPDFNCKALAVKPSETVTERETQNQLVNSIIYLKGHPVYTLSRDDTKIIDHYYALIYNRIQKPVHRYQNAEVRTLLNAFLLIIVGLMSSEMSLTATRTTIRGEQIVEKFLWLVNENNGHQRFVDYYAERLNITPKYLSTLVQKALGRTPSEVIRAVTIKEIERRLRYTKQSIKEISNALDFPNTSFFGRYFKHYSGMTPVAYRKKYMS
ncbi:MAG: helix-turn-helix domain-containing protein [Bacteroidales bacterium]|nr:helix-turn-helix domain-containing protein [Bacteroidales bacterium]